MTETTTQPDPQVVAWMRAYLREHPTPITYGADRKATTIRAYAHAHSPNASISGTGFGLADLSVAYDAARQPLAVADIPAGQGAASLYLTRSDGELDLYYRHGDGIGDRILILDPHPALRDHLAATLPTIDTTEEH